MVMSNKALRDWERSIVNTTRNEMHHFSEQLVGKYCEARPHWNRGKAAPTARTCRIDSIFLWEGVICARMTWYAVNTGAELVSDWTRQSLPLERVDLNTLREEA